MKIVFYEMAFKRTINHAIANSNVSKMVCKSAAINCEWEPTRQKERKEKNELNGGDRWPHFTVMTNIVMRTQFHFQLLSFHFYFVELKKGETQM